MPEIPGHARCFRDKNLRQKILRMAAGSPAGEMSDGHFQGRTADREDLQDLWGPTVTVTMTIYSRSQLMGVEPMKDSPGFGSVIWAVLANSAGGTVLVTVTIRLLFRRHKKATDP
jgi:hypothetical protein